MGANNVANQKCAIGRGLAAISYKYDYKYILLFLRLIEKKLDSQGTDTTFRAISGSVLKSQVIPLSPLPIQHTIVREIKSRLSVCDKVEQNISESLEKAEALRQSILKKAFEGKPLSGAEIARCRQEADYEPASVLLERIRKENKHGK